MSLFFHSWLPYIYLYGVGGLLFLVGMIIIRKSGALNMKIKRHRFWFKVLVFGFFYFMLLHAVWICAALYL